MRLGMILPFVEPGGGALTTRGIADGALRIERAGFEGCWVFDAIGRGFLLPDPLTALAVAGTVTQRVELGTCIIQVPLRRPVELAHRALTTHLVCGGRLVLGVGAGSTKTDFDAVGVDFDRRFDLLAEALPIMRRLWTGERVGEAELSPWPEVAGGPPMLIGSWNTDRWIREAARTYDGWIASAARTSWDALERGLRVFREAGGKRAVVANLAVDLSTQEDAGPDAPSLRCPPAIARERLGRMKDLGFDDAILVCFDQRAETLDAIRALL